MEQRKDDLMRAVWFAGIDLLLFVDNIVFNNFKVGPRMEAIRQGEMNMRSGAGICCYY